MDFIDMDFEWDEAERQANIRKHGVDFLDAAAIFENDIFELVDDHEDYGEERWIALYDAVRRDPHHQCAKG